MITNQIERRRSLGIDDDQAVAVASQRSQEAARLAESNPGDELAAAFASDCAATSMALTREIAADNLRFLQERKS
jgi:hypothetical protein